MPHSYGYRARTRDMFAVPFRKNGTIALNTYMRVRLSGAGGGRARPHGRPTGII